MFLLLLQQDVPPRQRRDSLRVDAPKTGWLQRIVVVEHSLRTCCLRQEADGAVSSRPQCLQTIASCFTSSAQ